MPEMRDSILSEALRRGKAERGKGEIDYIRFREGFRGIERGTVIAGKRVIWGFPHIRRVFTLEKGLEKNIAAETIYAEEKIDGFNVRIALLGKKICAFSRGGFLDLFVTEKARGMKLERFFRDYPDSVLCAEMLGNTPYTEPADKFDVRLFVFDIDAGDGSYLPCEEKYKLLKKYGIESPPVLGKFSSGDYEGLRRLAVSINKARKEGMVLKSADRGKAVKYVTPLSDIEDIAKESGLLFDMPIGFFYQRVLRSAFFISDFGLPREEYEKRLGKAFYGALTGAIKDAKAGRPVSAEFEILIKDPAVWDDIRKHMSREVKLEVLWRREEEGGIRIRFSKVYRKTSKTLIAYAAGKGITD
ncbi:MAG: RNA ligase [Candidatus Micrarchaeota archaeon]